MNHEKKQPGWQVVLYTELRHLWLGWKGPILLLAFSLFLSAYVVLLSLDPELNVLSQRKMIDQTIQVSVLAGIIVALLLGADSFSGERDHRTLESLLLTPVPRGQLASGKLLAILSLWLGMMPIAIPYLALVARGTGIVGRAMLALIVPGSMLVALSAGVGVLISGLSHTNLLSFAFSSVIMLLLAAPTGLPGSVRDLALVKWLVTLDPVTAVASYQSALIADGQSWTSNLGLLASPLLLLILLAALGPRFFEGFLSLHGGVKQ